MKNTTPETFANVAVTCKANIYFDGRVVSHSLTLADGCRKTLGLIYPGNFKFNTEAPERMEIIAGECRVRIAGEEEWSAFAAGSRFDVPARSSFEIAVEVGIAEYICSFT